MCSRAILTTLLAATCIDAKATLAVLASVEAAAKSSCPSANNKKPRTIAFVRIDFWIEAHITGTSGLKLLQTAAAVLYFT